MTLHVEKPPRSIRFKGHKDACTETTCYCFDEDGDPMCGGCWQAACFCRCDREEIPDLDCPDDVDCEDADD